METGITVSVCKAWNNKNEYSPPFLVSLSDIDNFPTRQYKKNGIL